MYRLLLLLLLCGANVAAGAQVPDFLSVRKANGRTLRNFMPGLPITLQQRNGNWVEGPIHAIRNDSIIVQVFRVQRYMSTLGVMVSDTVGSVLRPVHYQDIDRVRISQKASFWQRRAGPLLIIGGAGYLLLNVLNGAILDDPIGGKANLRRLGIAAGAVGTGILIKKAFPVHEFSTSKHRIVYVNMRVAGRPM